MLKNSSGLKLEIEASKTFHKNTIPLLVSSALLRSRFMGQIDLARVGKDKAGWILEIAEVKSSDTGSEMFLRGQRSRLFSAGKFLSGIFGHRLKFILLSGEDSA